jgi:hypothetical protein
VSEPTPRQVLYALVAAGFLLVVLALVVAGAVSGLVPVWWTAATGIALATLSLWSALNWRRTSGVLLGSIGLFLAWTIGTLIVAS